MMYQGLGLDRNKLKIFLITAKISRRDKSVTLRMCIRRSCHRRRWREQYLFTAFNFLSYIRRELL